MNTIEILYQSHYEALVCQRLDLIARIEDVNNQISELKREARAKKIVLQN